VSRWEAPAKINLSLRVAEADGSGLHPLRSLVQTIEWCDLLTFEEGDEDQLTISGADLPEEGDNLIWKAVTALRSAVGIKQPFFDIHLDKAVAVAAGLGGGSSDAAATLFAAARLARVSPAVAEAVAPSVGADVPFLMVGGTAWMEGYGETLSPVPVEPDYAVVVVVPPFDLETAAVYQTWDRLDRPQGIPVVGRRLPPSLRPFGPLGNDLTPAAIALQPELDDWIADMADLFDGPVTMTGSGPALFGYFSDLDEAHSAAAAAPSQARATVAAVPRRNGAAQLPD